MNEHLNRWVKVAYRGLVVKVFIWYDQWNLVLNMQWLDMLILVTDRI